MVARGACMVDGDVRGCRGGGMHGCWGTCMVVGGCVVARGCA